MNQRARLNLLVIQIFIASLMVALLGRLFYLQVAAGPIYKDAALSIQSRDVVTPANRGFIVDSSGVPLALNRVGLAITVDRTKIDKLPDKGEAVIRNLVILLDFVFGFVYLIQIGIANILYYQLQLFLSLNFLLMLNLL